MRVLIADPIAPDGAEILSARGVDADTRLGLQEDELIAAIPDYDGLIVRQRDQGHAKSLGRGRKTPGRRTRRRRL